MENKLKPILFFDFDGVLSHDRYWRSLPGDQYQKIKELLFGTDTSFVSDWMLGKYTAEEVNHFVSEKTNIPYEELWDIFVKDCQTMHVSRDILETINELRNKNTTILITGNMDSFTRFTCPALGLENYFDYISNSFYEGMQKNSNDGELFLKYAKKYHIPIEKCKVFDDSKSVCKCFSKLGGTAYLVTEEQNLNYHLNKFMEITHTKGSDFIGKKVKLIFDRPFGTNHPKHGFLYELNYGYVPDTISPDGEELDAYYLSEKIPLNEAEGICIAYAHRENDDDDKLIVIKEDDSNEYSDEKIMELINFQEQWFKTKIIR